VKDYRAVLQLEELEEYLKKCVATGYASFDWETAASDETRFHYEPRLAELKGRIQGAKESLETNKQMLAVKAPSLTRTDIKDQEKHIRALEKEYSAMNDEFLKTPLDP